MWGHWVGNTVILRLELRFDRSFDVAAYNNGTRKNQFQLAMDEKLSHGGITAEQGILTRICDKSMRAYNLTLKDPAVVGESFEDTCLDGATYFILLALLRTSRTTEVYSQ